MDQIDVILPVRSEHKFLSAALSSIIQSEGIQTRVIFIDNSDSGLNHIRSGLRQHDIFIREKRPGFARAMNAPLMQEHDFSEYVGIMNSDDISHPLRFSTQVKTLKKTSSQLNICNVVNFRGTRRAKPFFGSLQYEEYHPLLLTLGAYGIEPAWCSTSEWWIRNSFRSEVLHPDIVDLDLALRIFPDTSISSTSEQLYYYRKHRHQMSRRSAPGSSYEMIEETFINFLSRYGIRSPGKEVLYFVRPHDIFRDSPEQFTKFKIEEFLCELQEVLMNLINSNQMRKSIQEIVSIRLNVQSRYRSAIRLAKLRLFDLTGSRLDI
jgi:glycosyltransferase involved in cell wall biosynthesis